MTVKELETWLSAALDAERFSRADDSVNGAQVGDLGANVAKVAFAVDASLETMRRASEKGADALVVHHGIFWKKGERVTGVTYERVRFLVESGMALLAYHLPLDAHPESGNNAAMARALGLVDVAPFGVYHGIAIGFSGRFARPKTMDEIVAAVLPDGSRPLSSLAFGKDRCETCAVVSGGAPFEVLQAIDSGIDCYVTGDASHSVYHAAMEAGINMVSAGHYATETWGPKALMERFALATGIPSLFVDLPTGL